MILELNDLRDMSRVLLPGLENLRMSKGSTKIKFAIGSLLGYTFQVDDNDCVSFFSADFTCS